MEENKIYLYYENDINRIAECKIGYIKELLYLGIIYLYKDKEYKLFYTILLLKVLLVIFFFLFIPFFIAIICLVVINLLTNFLLSYNYCDIVIDKYIKNGYIPLNKEASDYLIKKGIYFKLC